VRHFSRRPARWLNDHIVNFYLAILTDRAENRNKIYFFKTYFMSKLLNVSAADERQRNVFTFNNVEKWNKKSLTQSLFEYNKLFFPINHNNLHWTCVVVTFKEQCVEYYDSLHSDGGLYTTAVKGYLDMRHAIEQGSRLPDISSWKCVNNIADSPYQTNGKYLSILYHTIPYYTILYYTIQQLTILCLLLLFATVCCC
jgi:sentrin-specific protease 1